MTLDFSKMEKTAIENMLGGKGTIYMRRYMEGANKIMVVRVEPGCSIGEHTHTNNQEVVYCLSGHAKTTCDGVTEVMEPGVAYFCPKGHTHTVFNDGDEVMTMYCVVTPAE